MIYVNGERFINCKYLLLNVPIEKMTRIENLLSIDEISDNLDKSMEYESLLLPETVPLIPPEVEFWGHCSNLQVWYENDYNTGLLHSNISFPLLRKLCDAGDPLAKNVFSEEIARRFDSEYLPVMMSLLLGGYLFYLTPEQFESLKFFDRFKTVNIQDLKSSGANPQPQLLEAFIQYIANFRAKTVNEWKTKAKMLRAFKGDEQSDECFQKAMEQFPDNEELLIARVRDLNERGKPQEALRYMKILTEIVPQKAFYWVGLGIAMFNQNHIEKTILYLEKALEINPKIPIAKLRLAEAYHISREFVKRDNLIIDYYEKNDLKLPFLRDFAFFSSGIGKYFYAIPLLKKVLFLMPDDSESWFALAMAYKDYGKYMHQRRCLKKVVSLSNDPFLTSDALNLLGLAYIEGEVWNFKKGIEYFKDAVQLNPENEMAWANQSPTYAMLLDMERAGLALDISQKVKELKELKELPEVGTANAIARVRRELEVLKTTYWSASFTCPFCKVETVDRPSTCSSCGRSLDDLFKMDTKSKSTQSENTHSKDTHLSARKEIKAMALKSPQLEDEVLMYTYKKFTSQEKDRINFTLPEELLPEETGLIKMFWPSLDFGHISPVQSLAVSPDGRYLASGCNDIKLWDLHENSFVRTMKGHTGAVSSISFYENLIISSAWDSTIRIWDLATGKQLHQFQTPKKDDGIVHCFQALITSNGLLITELSEGNSEYPDWVEVWELKTGKLVKSIETGFDHYGSLCLLPDEKIAGILEFDDIGIVDINTGQVLQVFTGIVDEPNEYRESDYLTDLKLTPDKKYFITRSEQGITKKIDSRTGKIMFSKEIGGRFWTKVLRNGKLAIAQGYNVAILNPYSLELEERLIGPAPGEYRGYIRDIVLTPDMKRLFCGMNTQISEWDYRGKKYLGSLGGLKTRCSTNKVKGNFAVTLVNDEIFYWDVLTGDVIKHWLVKSESRSLYTSAKGDYFTTGIVSSYRASHQLWDLTSFTLVTEISDFSIHCFNEAGNLLAGTPWKIYSFSSTREEKDKGVIVVIELPSKKVLSSVKIHSDYVSGIAFSPDNVRVASSSYDRTVKIWNYRTGEITLIIESYSKGRPLAFSPDGKVLVGGSSWRGPPNITFWDAEDGKEIRKLRVKAGNFSQFAFTPMGEYFASGGGKEAFIWNFAKGVVFGPFTHLAKISQIGFINNDKLLMVVDLNGHAYIWDYMKKKPEQIDKNGLEVKSVLKRYDYQVFSNGFPKVEVYSLKDLEEKAHNNPKALIRDFFKLPQFSWENIVAGLNCEIELEIKEFYELLKFALNREISKILYDMFDFTTFNIFILLVRYGFTQFLEGVDYEKLCKDTDSEFLPNLTAMLSDSNLSKRSDIINSVTRFVEEQFTPSGKELFTQSCNGLYPHAEELPIDHSIASLQLAIMKRFQTFSERTIKFLLKKRYLRYLTREQKKTLLEVWMDNDIENVVVYLIGNGFLHQFGKKYEPIIVKRLTTHVDAREKNYLKTDFDALLEELNLVSRDEFSEQLLNEDRSLLKEIFDLRHDITLEGETCYNHLAVLKELFGFLEQLSLEGDRYKATMKRQVKELFEFPSIVTVFPLLMYNFYKLLPLEEFKEMMTRDNSPFLNNLLNYLGHETLMKYFDHQLIPCYILYEYFDEELRRIFAEKVRKLPPVQRGAVIDGLTKSFNHKTFNRRILELISQIQHKIEFQLVKGGLLRVAYYSQEKRRNELVNPSEMIIEDEEIRLRPSFPRDNQQEIILKKQGGFTRMNLFQSIHERYKTLYREHFESKNQNHIWSVYFKDLYIDAVFYDKETKVFRVYIRDTAKAYQA